jgi:hypothetical protein
VNRLKQIRERKSLTLAQLSARTSIPLRVLGDYEENIAEISPAHVKVLSKALWVKPDELLAPEGPAAPAPAPYGASHPAPAAPVAGAPMSPAVAPMVAPGANAGYAPRPYAPPAPYGAPRPEGPRPPRPPGPAGDAGRGAPRAGGRARREPVVMPATDGQITEIMRLAARLNLSTEEIESEFGRSIDNITRFDAREWIKKLREDAIAKAPPAKVHFGQWPGLKDDREAVYLAEQRDQGATLRVALFNGQVFEGPIIDFTPYTITLEDAAAGAGEQVVLRKLAIAYYQRTGAGNGRRAEPAAEAQDRAPFPGSAEPAFATPGAAMASAAPAAESGAPAPAATESAPTPAGVEAASTPAAAESAPAEAAAESAAVAATDPPAKPRASRARTAAPQKPDLEMAAASEDSEPAATDAAPAASAGGEEGAG